MTFHFQGLGAASRNDVPVGDPEECAHGISVPLLPDRQCVDLTKPAAIRELKNLVNEAAGYAMRMDTDLWTPEEELSLWQWAADQEARPGKVPWSAKELLRQTPSRWVYPSPLGLFVLWENRKCGQACSGKYPLFAAIDQGLPAVAINAPRTGMPGRPVPPDEPPPDTPPDTPPDRPIARASMAAAALLGTGAVLLGWYALQRAKRSRS